MMSRLFGSILLTVLIDSVHSCLPSGICGANPFCGGPGILPPIPPIGMNQPMSPCQQRGGMMGNPMGCGAGMACGPYGCYQRRAAHGSSIYKPEKRSNFTGYSRFSSPDWEDLEAASPTVAALRRSPQKIINPNKAFYSCCMDRKLPDACLKKCQYNEYRRETIIGMYLQQDGCPLEAVREIQFCAAQGKDHRACCERNSVSTTLAGQKCLVFCDQRPGHVVQLDLTYLPCFERFNEMTSCFVSSFRNYIDSTK